MQSVSGKKSAGRMWGNVDKKGRVDGRLERETKGRVERIEEMHEERKSQGSGWCKSKNRDDSRKCSWPEEREGRETKRLTYMQGQGWDGWEGTERQREGVMCRAAWWGAGGGVLMRRVALCGWSECLGWVD